MNDKRKSTLSKSRFLSGLQCPKRLYLETHGRDLATPPDAFQKRIFSNGHAVGQLARTRFPGGLLIEASFSEVSKALEQTQKAIQEKASVIFEGAFCARDTFIRADVLERSGDSWNIIEVKSTCTIHDSHLLDLAVQRFVIEQSGLPVSRTFLMHLNQECRFPHLENLFVQDDVTDRVKGKLPAIPATIDSYLAILSSDSVPRTPVGPQCFHPYPCPFEAHCWQGVRRPSIFAIPRLHPSRARELISKGIRSIHDIPADYPLSETQGQYVRQLQRGQPAILWPAIQDLLSRLQYPVHFLDLQTHMDTIPRLKGLRPFDQYPFMYGLHILDESKRLASAGYLHSDSSDPRPHLAQSLCNEIGSEGSIVVYNGAQQRRIVKNLAWDVSPFRGDLLSMFDRIFELLPVFQNFYFDPRFAGSLSFEDIYPILLPDLSPSSLVIRDSAEAQLAWERLILTENEEEKGPLVQALKVFGSQTSLALFRVCQLLKKRSLEPNPGLNKSANDGNGE
jgi:hypothetical protein